MIIKNQNSFEIELYIEIKTFSYLALNDLIKIAKVVLIAPEKIYIVYKQKTPHLVYRYWFIYFGQKIKYSSYHGGLKNVNNKMHEM